MILSKEQADRLEEKNTHNPEGMTRTELTLLSVYRELQEKTPGVWTLFKEIDDDA